MNFLQKISALIKAHKIISGIMIIVIIYAGYAWYQKIHPAKAAVQYVTQAAVKGTLVVGVTGSGQVSAQNKIDLKPGGSGQTTSAITSVNVKQGDQVKAGQVIATVDEKNNNVALVQARASLASAQASYDKLLAGLTGTDLETAQLSVDEAQQALSKAQTDYNTTVTTQQTAVGKALSSFLSSGLLAVPSNSIDTTTISVGGAYTGTTQGSYTISAYQASSGMYFTAVGLGYQNALITPGLPQTLSDGLNITFSNTGSIHNFTTWTIQVPNTQSNNYVSNQFAYNSALQTQTQTLASAQNTIQSAQNSLKSAELGLQSKTAPPTNADTAQAQAQIAQAQAGLASAEVNYGNNIIKSPFDGQVAAVNNQVGDQVTSSTVVATVVTNQKLAIIPLNEVDASNVKIGQKANLTFDAINGLNITGSVVQVDTIGTVSQGVVTYNVKVGMDTQNDQIKPGMSVSVEIITKADTDVLTVPSTAVKSNAGGGNYVLMLDANGKPQQKSVVIAASNDTDTEITSGLNEGDMVVTQTISSSASTTSTTRSSTIIPGLGGGGGTFRATGRAGAGAGQ